MRKIIKLAIFISLFASAGKAQTISLQNFEDAIKAINAESDAYLQKPSNYVSRYTFSNLIKADFSALTGADNTATVGQYASLSVDPNSYKLAYTPFASNGGDLVNGEFRNIFSANVSGTLSSESLLNLKDWRTLVGSFSWTRVFHTGYKEDKKKPGLPVYDQIYKEIHDVMLDQYSKSQNHKLTSLNHAEFDDVETLKKAYLDSVSKYEQLLTKDLWKSKHFWWVKLTGNIASFDNVNYYVKGDASTFDAPKQSAIYTGSVNASLNYYKGFSKRLNLYINVNGQFGRKSMFGEIYTASTYNAFHKLSDSSFVQKSNLQVFENPGEDVATRWLPNFGGEVIALYSFKSFGLGLDFLYSHNVVISDKPGISTGFISTPNLGIIFGLKDKNGISNVNIEPYFQFKDFVDVTMPSQHLFGLKFSVPINSLY